MVNSLVVFYEKYKDTINDSGAAKFMYDRVMMILSNMYRYYLFNWRTEDGHTIISTYDKELKSKCQFLFNEMEDYLFKNKISFCYVQRWRKSNYNDRALSFLLYRLFYKCVENVRNRIQK
jgi:hypothetical protein